MAVCGQFEGQPRIPLWMSNPGNPQWMKPRPPSTLTSAGRGQGPPQATLRSSELGQGKTNVLPSSETYHSS
eukprot:5207396-Amphidinium_carterae.1